MAQTTVSINYTPQVCNLHIIKYNHYYYTMVVQIVQMTYINAITSKLKWHKRAIKSNQMA